jgi:hypothetical protein
MPVIVVDLELESTLSLNGVLAEAVVVEHHVDAPAFASYGDPLGCVEE